MFYVGLDIHDKRIANYVLSEAGQVARRATPRARRASSRGWLGG